MSGKIKSTNKLDTGELKCDYQINDYILELRCKENQKIIKDLTSQLEEMKVKIADLTSKMSANDRISSA